MLDTQGPDRAAALHNLLAAAQSQRNCAAAHQPTREQHHMLAIFDRVLARIASQGAAHNLAPVLESFDDFLWASHAVVHCQSDCERLIWIDRYRPLEVGLAVNDLCAVKLMHT